MRAKCHDGNRLAAMCASLASLSLKHGVHFWIESPSWSRRKPFLRLRRSHAVGVTPVDYSRFGMKWRKRTRFLTTYTTLIELRGVGCHCTRDHEHITLRGTGLDGKLWTKTAESYTLMSLLITYLAGSLAGWLSLLAPAPRAS